MPANLRIFRKTGLDQVIETRRGMGLQDREERRIDMQNRPNYAGVAFALERLASGHHFKNHGTERENVRASICVPTLQLFWGHVLDRAKDGSLAGQGRSLGGRTREICEEALAEVEFGQPEVQQFRTRFG